MTLIVAIRCADGVVIGSDGAATFAPMGQPTIRQPITSKITVIDGSLVLGVSGSIGVAQRIAAEIERQNAGGALTGARAVDVGVTLRDAIWNGVLSHEYQIAAVAQPVIGGLAQQDALCSCLLALPGSQRSELIQFDHVASPEVATDDLPFVTIGSGQQTADPFLAFLKRIFWPSRLPNLGEGTFAVLWTLQHAIGVNPGGLSDPKTVYNLSNVGGQWQAHRLDDSDVAEHLEAVSAAEQRLRSFAQDSEPTGPPPPSP